MMPPYLTDSVTPLPLAAAARRGDPAHLLYDLQQLAVRAADVRQQGLDRRIICLTHLASPSSNPLCAEHNAFSVVWSETNRALE
ncbi:hypothetical protein ACJ8OK_13580 [Serratia sp. CY71090]|uniref:hypothetical protein n=1 Tax=Serratia sp. CY71090 TaxID=3383672 RepID=UPI003FA04302